MPKPVRFTRRSRRHKIGRAHVWHVMGAWPGREIPAEGADDRGWEWTGPDDRGLTLHIVAIETAECYLVIHVMPTYRKGRNS